MLTESTTTAVACIVRNGLATDGDLPVHPFTGQRALFVLPSGRIGWPMAGGADDGADDGDTNDDATGSDGGDDKKDGSDDGDVDGADKLGDAGKRALDEMKGKWKTERDKRKAYDELFSRYGVTADEVDRILAAQRGGSDDKKDGGDKPDLEQVRQQARQEARAEAVRERALDKIEAKAARKFADPEDAVALLGRRLDDFIDNGQVDGDAITEALDELLEKKPHLAAGADKKRFDGDADSGARKGDKKKAASLEEAIGNHYAGNKR